MIAGVARVGAAGALASVSPKLSPVFVVDAGAIVAVAGVVSAATFHGAARIPAPELEAWS